MACIFGGFCFQVTRLCWYSRAGLGRILNVRSIMGSYQGTALNYCKICRRHLNGAVSCPGCGATGVELGSVQDARSTMNMPRVEDRGDDSGLPPEFVPPSPDESEEDLDDPDREPDPDPGRAPEAATAGGAGLDERKPAAASAPAPSSAYAYAEPPAPRALHAVSSTRDLDDDTSSFDLVTGEHRGGRGSRRRGLGLLVTGGCAGVAIVGFLVLGGGGSGKAAGVAVRNSGTVSVVDSPAGTGTGTAGSGQNLGTASFAAPTESSAPPSTSASATATHTVSKAPSTQSAPTTTTPTSSTPTPSMSRPRSTPTKTCYLLCL